MRKIAIIPARYASVRLPGKPLALIAGKPMLQWVYESALNSGVFDEVIIATDDDRIKVAALAWNARVEITSPAHQSGTDRCNEAQKRLKLAEDDLVINIQGDEPFITREPLLAVTELAQKHSIATASRKFASTQEWQSPNAVKVIADDHQRAMLFSRLPIPYHFPGQDCNSLLARKHIGLYGFKAGTLAQISLLPQSSLENAEKLEQLRWMQAGYSIHVEEVEYEGLSIDTAADLERANLLAAAF